MSHRISLAFALAGLVAGCGNNNNGGGSTDMSAAGGGGDMPMLMTTTIADALMNKITTPITVNAIVTGIVGDPATATTWYIQDPAGGPYSGVAVFCSHTAKTPCPMTINPPLLHDQITITGAITSFRGKNELAPTAQMTTKANATPAAPMAVADTAAAYNGTDASVRSFPVKLMGASFTVDNVAPMALYDTKCRGDGGAGSMPSCSGCMPPTYSGFSANDGAGATIYVEQTFYKSVTLASSPECSGMATTADQVIVGRKFTALGGILDVDPFAPKGSTVVVLQPTSSADYK